MEKYLIHNFETCTREPILRKMKDGSLICMFLTGGVEEPLNENFVAVSRSYDDGKTWTEPEKLFDHKIRGVWCTEIFTGDENPFAIVHTYNANCWYRELHTFISVTEDNGRTWSEPLNVPGCLDGCSLRQAITLSNGDTLIPLYWQESLGKFDWSGGKGWDNLYFRTGVGIRPKGKKHWERYGYIASDERSLWEPNAVEFENGHIIMYIRSDIGYLQYVESFDYGRTWSELKKLDIPHSDSKITCIKVRGKVLMFNNAVEKDRTHLEMSVSDDGLNFKHICYLEDENESFFYPHPFCDDETETLYVAYENRRQHYLKKFTYSEIGI